MASNVPHETAKIYRFPLRPPMAAVADHPHSKQAADQRLQHAPGIQFGSSWYHEAAVQEADPTRKP